MPLLNKKPLERCEPPSNVKLTDKVYYLEASNEIFLTYDEFFERMIQLNSTLFSCEYTGKTGLTFFEALESEKQAMRALGNFPPQLENSILFLVRNHLCRGRFEDLLNDVSLFMKDRYFVGEECLYIDGNQRIPVRITGITIASDWQADKIAGCKEPQVPPPEIFQYSLDFLDSNCLYSDLRSGTDLSGHSLFPHTSLFRARSSVSKPKLKLYLKNSCVVRDGRYDIKEKFVDEIDSLTWANTCGGPIPYFPRTPMLQRGRQPKPATLLPTTPTTRLEESSVNGELQTKKLLEVLSNGTQKRSATKEGKPQLKKSSTARAQSDNKNDKKLMQINAQQEELASVFENARKFGVDLTKYEQKTRLLTSSEISELKLSIKSSKTQERELAREAKKMKIKAKHQWQKKRDDLECDDLKGRPKCCTLSRFAIKFPKEHRKAVLAFGGPKGHDTLSTQSNTWAFPAYPALNLPPWLNDDELSEYLAILQFFTAFQVDECLKTIRMKEMLKSE
ncbi:Histidine-containing phosphotransfer protein 3 [Parelaphostrongylus tenuis]|uniref:Histidine-containing phosphotransfer protein 3 n=1 Tax=Parelaphostrongylus tenuis TaxID=148309 RepID=A0AAD5WIM5_PARTN|nr:Histidine-containing phosphotransfer protein 3 [Parelaphostrongylus tenuis]